MDERLENISIESLVSCTKRLGWQGDKVRLDVDTNKEGASKLMLIGKILSKKSFPRPIVKDIVHKAWSVTYDVEVNVVDKNVFMFTFKHEADVRKAWDRRPWCIKGEHLIPKKINANLSLNEVDFKTTEFWVQVHGLPLNTQNEKKLLRIGGFIGRAIDTDLTGSEVAQW
jgi:hypothetical protein